MTKHIMTSIAAALTLLFLATPKHVVAQDVDCGLQCLICGASKFEGDMHSPNGAYDMKCQTGDPGEGCAQAGCGQTATNDDLVPAETIAEIVQSVQTEAEIRALAAAYGDRLLVVPERNAVVVLGTLCSAEWLASMTFVARDRVDLLARYSVASLEQFVAEREAAAPVATD